MIMWSFLLCNWKRILMEYSESLKKNRDFQVIYRQGTSYANRYLVMYVKENHLEKNRIGISVSKKVGNSVVRHRLTRLIRESYRLNEQKFRSGLDIVVVARVNAKGRSCRRSRRRCFIWGGFKRFWIRRKRSLRIRTSVCAAVKMVLEARMKVILIKMIRFYQKYLSPLKRTRCPYIPTCSQYGLEAIQKYGALKGSLLAAWRILRCNPFSHGGYDPVP